MNGGGEEGKVKWRVVWIVKGRQEGRMVKGGWYGL